MGICPLDKVWQIGNICNMIPVLSEFSEEKQIHILLCQSKSIISIRKDAILELDVWLASVKTMPKIQDFLIKGITNFFSSQSTTYPWILRHKKRWEGKRNFLKGFITTELISRQHKYFLDWHSGKSDSQWGVQLISRLWHLIFIHCTHINEALYDMEAIDKIVVVDRLDIDMRKEHLTGLTSLLSVYTSYVYLQLSVILKKSFKYKWRWFLVVISGHESFTIIDKPDDFSSNTLLH